MMRIVFMGTPEFAAPSLRALAAAYEVVGVVTQPDAPAGRGQALAESAVKRAALALGLPVLQPASLKAPEAIAALAAMRPDLIVVAAFGQILRRAVLEMPRMGCLNVHASLLPRWRGASPVPAAIAAGDLETGITLMRMDPGLDTGPILAQRREPILAGDTTASLLDRLGALGANLLRDVLPDYARGEMPPHPQDAALATTCGLIKKDDGRINWARPVEAIERQVRAMTPWPGAWTTWNGKQLRVLRARISPPIARQTPGTVIQLGKTIGIVCGAGTLEVIDAQLEGKKPMPAGDLVRGQRGLVGAVLGG